MNEPTQDLMNLSAAVRRVLSMAGLQDRTDDSNDIGRSGGGFYVSPDDEAVEVRWAVGTDLNAALDDIQHREANAHHPMVVFEQLALRVMRQAMTELLVDAGYIIEVHHDNDPELPWTRLWVRGHVDQHLP